MSSLVKYIKDNVDPEEYYKRIFSEISWHGVSDEARVLSPFTSEKTPSFSVNRKTGAWYSFCDADQHGGNHIISFHAALYEMSYRKACIQIFDWFIHPVVSENKVRKFAWNLKQTPVVLKYLRGRQISAKII